MEDTMEIMIAAKDKAAERLSKDDHGGKKKHKKEKEKGNYTSIMTGISDLIKDWEPETPEGERYLSDLEALYDGEHTKDKEREEEEY
jgi:hypothetical protein